MIAQSFFELGLHVAIVNIASHESVGLELDEEGQITGGPGRPLASRELGPAVVCLVPRRPLSWRWVSVEPGSWVGKLRSDRLGSTLGGARRIVAGVLSEPAFIVLLEGCGQLAIVNRYRIFQGITVCGIWTCVQSWVSGSGPQ